jgi:hypothetical protein
MSTAKSNTGHLNGRPRPRVAPAEKVDPPDFFESESTIVDSALPMSDWARPSEPPSNAAVQSISRMLEEAIDGSNPQIELQRRAEAAAPLVPPKLVAPVSKLKSDSALQVPRSRRSRALLIALAGTLAVAVALLLLARADLLPIRF